MNGHQPAPPDAARSAGVNRVLAARILTATVLGTLFVAGTLWLPPWAVGGLVAIAGFVAALEWAALAGIVGNAGRMLYALLTLAAAASIQFAIGAGGPIDGVLIAAAAWWLLAGVWIIAYELCGHPVVHAAAPLAVAGWLAIVPTLLAIWMLLARAPLALLGLFALVWSADILAFFGGRAFGHRRLAQRVSPGKTWEGLLIALLGTTAIAALVAVYLRPDGWLPLVLLAALTVVLSVIGDLLESLLKRLRGVKDSGALLPGHGGVLDRVDSILAAAPTFTLGLAAMEYL